MRRLQQLLMHLGYDTGGADGIFGSRTSAAVRDFLEQRALPAGGAPRTQVRRALEAALAAPGNGSPVSS